MDNLDADVDEKILKHIQDSHTKFPMLTDKGGTLIDYDGQVRLLEIERARGGL
ncbi:hypothetical protein EXIGLDRAFT_725265 [Exidia glandulosa HHB12029]|uniref:Uncharacterized protein n=1 Tax=Exidia glandulosa HHB12029 TaxID=1314781 RepID=A0A165E3T8_EXIGL|nr:hypothetical protein EXIGLDRAFT_725265 [Exidia glandulosa HHB12029]